MKTYDASILCSCGITPIETAYSYRSISPPTLRKFTEINEFINLKTVRFWTGASIVKSVRDNICYNPLKGLG